MAMPRAQREVCSHENCDMEPCTFYTWMTYEYDEVWGWVTICDRCERTYPGTLPEQHEEERH